MSADIRHFGLTSTGEAIEAIRLRAEGIEATILTFGAVIQDLRLEGVPYGLTQGSDRVSDYEGAMRYHGSLIGPVANRIDHARAPIAGVIHEFEMHQSERFTLHSGSVGTHLKRWTLVEASDASVTLSLTLPDGEGGFPGNRHVSARFGLSKGRLALTVTGTTDRTTLMNFANHSYWNLDGSDRWDGHVLRVAADRYLPTDDAFLVTGEILATADSPLDFRTAREIAVDAPPLDNCLCLSDADTSLRPVLWLTGRSGVSLEVATTAPGIHVYDGRHAIRPGRAAYEGIAIEPEGWPDAANHPAFPSIELAPGQTYHQHSEWRFSR